MAKIPSIMRLTGTGADVINGVRNAASAYYQQYDATISTKNYATYNSAVISGVVDNSPINDATKIGGYYSGSNSGLTLTDYPAFFEIDVLNRLKRKSKAFIYALRRRYPIYG